MTAIRTAQKVDNPVPPVLRDRGLLTQVADAVSVDRWEAGVTFVGYDATNKPVLVTHDWCNADSLAARTAPDSDIPAFQAFSIWDGETCSTLAVEPEWLSARTHHRVDLWTSFNVAKELMSGATTGNPSLKSTAVLVSGTHTPKAALMRLELDWAAAFGNQRADIHINPALLMLLSPYLDSEVEEVETETMTANADGTTETTTERTTYRAYGTPSGHRVIFDAGYGNVAPTAGSSSTDADHLWMYASGPVAVKVGQVMDNAIAGSLSYTRNEFNARSHVVALAAFDTDTVLAVKVSIADAVIDV